MAVLASLLLCAAVAAAWMPDSSSKLYFKYGEGPSDKFFGNETASDHFRLLDKDENSILIGGRNTVYNLSLYDLAENVEQRLVWHSTAAHRELCQLKGKSADDCQNYPRVVARLGAGRTLVCGTNAFKPLCRHYNAAAERFDEFEGTGRCPYDPQHNSTSIYASGQLYTATAADFSGTDPLVYREPLRTDRSDLRQLNDPSFVGAVSNENNVFFFYRETAVEYMNCGKAVYSRVARVCINDRGGPHQFGDRWTTFLKARLNCSMPGDYPFYFDEIQSISGLINGVYGDSGMRNDIIYAVLTTPVNAIGGSAVCAFAMRDIIAAFEGSFKAQESINSNWLPLPDEKVSIPRPGSCVEDSRTLPDTTFNFIKTHILMDQAVPSYLAKPLLVRVSLQYRFSSITVHPQVQAMSGNKYDILYIGTDDGRIIKAVNVASAEGDFDYSIDEEGKNPVKTIVISEVQVLPQGTPIKQLHVSLANEKLVVISEEIVKNVPMSHCNNMSSCRECVTLQDPHCAWDSKMQQCAWVGNRQFPNPERFFQNVESGKSDICNKLPSLATNDWQHKPKHHDSANNAVKQPLRPEPDLRPKDDLNNEIVIELVENNVITDRNTIHKHEQDSLTVNKAENVIYTAQALFTAVVASCVVTLLVGFVIGYLFSGDFGIHFSQTPRPSTSTITI